MYDDLKKEISRTMLQDRQALIDLTSAQVKAMNKIWAETIITNQEKFYYRIYEYSIRGRRLYYFEKNGLRLTTNKKASIISELVNVVDGCIIRYSDRNVEEYRVNSDSSTYTFNSAHNASYSYHDAKIWTLPIATPRNYNSANFSKSSVFKDIGFMDVIAMSHLPNGARFVSEIINQGPVSENAIRKTGVFQLILLCLSLNIYSLDAISAKANIPMSTLAKFKINGVEISKFIRKYKYDLIQELLKTEDPHIVARKIGYSSKYKMQNFINDMEIFNSD